VVTRESSKQNKL